MPKNNRYISLSEFLKNGENIVIDEGTSFKSQGVCHPIPFYHGSPKIVESFIHECDEYAMQVSIANEYDILSIIIEDDSSRRTYRK